MDKKMLLAILAVFAVGVLCGALLLARFPGAAVWFGGSAHVDFTANSVHATITFYKNGVKVFEQYHAGAVTKLGLNTTFAKLTGNSTMYNMTVYNLNVTWIGIGNMGTLNTDSTVLPGEWNRTSATQHDGLYNSCNWTAVIHPGAGPYTADCFGIYYESAGNSLFAYDTFTEVTGIDNTFTITCEFKISAS
jgi:hypothetical protein